MSYATETPSVTARISTWIEQALRAMARESQAGDHFRQVETLRSLSDEQLAARGLTRGGIARRVFVEHRLAF
ncbi:hypothetical protein SAMN05421688_2110 [Poseidonocella pacifica]|uniref:DUF1127 domain-containing protein n=1 Tax=Poseidonocella pacifica TaxID=871651 RepID=A0A1I0XDM2_9RHOB|nr:hypothetical protein [Poseidonocella pacifica]SFA98526.1 hypothetical protein SAMN05421688_2110 [Poseidonocella pacifica]